MSQKNNQLVWGLLLLFFGCAAALIPSTEECVINEAGECVEEDLFNNEENPNLEKNVVGVLSKLSASLPKVSIKQRTVIVT